MTAIQTGLPPRSAIAPAHSWNRESVFASKGDWEAACEEAPRLLAAIEGFKGRLGESPAVLADYLDAAEHLMLSVGKVFVYGSMSNSVDQTDQEAVAMVGRARALMGRLVAATAFARPELLAIGRDRLGQWLKAEPRLSHLGQYLDNLFRTQEHVRSGEVEEILGMVIDPFSGASSTYGLLANGDLKFRPARSKDGGEVPLAQGNFSTLLDSPDRELRRSAFESYTDAYLAFKSTFASLLFTSVKQDVMRARVRRYESSLAASLFENNIPVEVFQNLLDTYKKHIPTWHKYWSVRRRILGYAELHPYDIWAPLTEQHPQVPYTQAVDWISAGMAPLGDEYVNALRRGCLEDRWVDIYPNQGKRMGAFSNGWHNTHPFIMMSYDDNLGAMSTLAHELGHSMHSYYSRRHQRPVYSGYSLFVAEVASNFNQALTRDYLMKQSSDPAFQIAVIEEAMGNFHRYFFIMPTLARFEMEIHARAEKGMGVTADDMNSLMADLFSEGYGSEMVVDRDRVGITWATFGHLYSSFYVYQYATGISAAHALAGKVLRGGPDAARRYVEFLSAGSSMYPLDALKHAGVDMATPEAVETTFGVLADYVERLEKLAGL